MTPAEAVVMDWLLERGYTREQAARALVALSLPEPDEAVKEREREWAKKWGPTTGVVTTAGLHLEAERRGYLPREGTWCFLR